MYDHTGIYAPRRKFEKLINIYQNAKPLRSSSMTSLKVFYKDFVNLSYENASFDIDSFERLCMAAAFVFLNYNSILVCEIDRRVHSKFTTSK